jgi:hypothetical protein
MMISIAIGRAFKCLKTGGVVSLKEKKEFVEPEVVKCEESLDEITLCFNRYNDNDDHYDWRWR